MSSSAGAAAAQRALSRAPGLRVDWLAEVPYREGLRLQEEAIDAVRRGGEDRLLLLEHPPVITLGRSGSLDQLLESRERLAGRGVEVVNVARGGGITYHGRGQLVGYLISNLRAGGQPDVRRHLRELEAALVDALTLLGVDACVVAGRTGVFAAPGADSPARKLASIGVGVRHWVSHHGFALNVDIDLREFDAIVPCGLADVEMTSLARAGAGSGPALAVRAREAIAQSFGARFGLPASRQARDTCRKGDPENASGALDRALRRADDSPLETAAPPLRSFGLVLHHDGSWTHEGQPFRNRRLREKFDRSVRYLPEAGGVYVVQIGRFRGLIEVEEAGFFVEDLDLARGRLRLSDGTSCALDVASLSTSGIDGALLCRVKWQGAGEALLARFSHRAHSELLGAVDERGTALRVAGRLLALPTL